MRLKGAIGPTERVVCVLTGHLLKDPESVLAYHVRSAAGAPSASSAPSTPGVPGAPRRNAPVEISAELAAVARVLRDAMPSRE
jgi:threonine synthase